MATPHQPHCKQVHKTDLVVVNDVNNDSKLALERAVVDEDHAAGLDESVEAHLGSR